jgi:hypothetical protein
MAVMIGIQHGARLTNAAVFFLDEPTNGCIVIDAVRDAVERYFHVRRPSAILDNGHTLLTYPSSKVRTVLNMRAWCDCVYSTLHNTVVAEEHFRVLGPGFCVFVNVIPKRAVQ